MSKGRGTQIWVSYNAGSSAKLLNEVENLLDNTASVALMRYEKLVDVPDVNQKGGDEFNNDREVPYLQGKTVKYFLDAGDSISSLIERIACQTRLVVCLSKQYFQSPYCMAELASAIAHGNVKGWRIVNQLTGHDLEQILKGKIAVRTFVPDQGEELQDHILADALYLTAKVRYRDCLYVTRDDIQKKLSELADKSFTEAKGQQLLDSCTKLAKQRIYVTPERSKEFIEWVDTDDIASEVFEKYAVKDKVTEILDSASGKIRLTYKGTSRSKNIEAIIAEYKENNRVESLPFNRFLARLAGFLALPTVNPQWREQVGASPNAPMFIDIRDEQYKHLEVTLAHGELISQGPGLRPRVNDTMPTADLLEFSDRPARPIAANTERDSKIRHMTETLWAYLEDNPVSECPINDPEHPTGLNSRSRSDVCSRVKQGLFKSAAGTSVLYVDPGDFDTEHEWESLLHEFLFRIRQSDSGTPYILPLSVVVCRVRDADSAYTILLDEHFVADRYVLINKILKHRDSR